MYETKFYDFVNFWLYESQKAWFQGDVSLSFDHVFLCIYILTVTIF